MTKPSSPGVVIAFAVAAALAIVLTGPLLLFNPWLVSAEQARQGVAASLGTDQASVDRVTRAMLGDLFTGGNFLANIDNGPPILDASERSHMQDVGGLVRGLAILEIIALIVLVVTGRWLRRERPRRGRALLRAAAGVGVAAIVVGAAFALAFDAAFAAFHALFFPQGNWQFGPDSNLIRLFPDPFWFEVSLLAGASIVLGALLAAWLARRDLGSDAAGG